MNSEGEARGVSQVCLIVVHSGIEDVKEGAE